ncbi:DUF4233 domain-containing protein [Nocardioides yefusunii]|uniref:DUF4233 domain-containing protein n=1 Tax=Nocardioides yefusunii TaxID=2500546 RepID=A0ABW1QXG0_9ACTN|nr:DUF4233 domain-containing protein [Nocardioides yefusunii]
MSNQPEQQAELENPTLGTDGDEGVDEAVDTRTPEEIAAKELRKAPRRGLCAAVLCLGAIAYGLMTPVLIGVTEVNTVLAWVVGVGLCVLSFLTAGLLRKEWGYWLGGAIQVASILVGFWIPVMFFLGGVFALLWFGSDALGRKIEREKREAWTAWVAEQNALKA